MIEVKIPGKLYVSGEYNVLNKGGNAILVSVDRFLTVLINPNDDYVFESSISSYKWIVTEGLPQFSFKEKDISKYALLQAFKYLRYLGVKHKPFKIKVNNELVYKGTKLGLGSSSAITLAVIKAVINFHGQQLSDQLWFKLAVLSQVEGNYLSSGGDLASGITQGWTYYERYDLIWLLHHKGDYDFILNNPWPNLVIERIIVNSAFKIKGIWTQIPHLNSNIDFNTTLDKSNTYRQFMKDSYGIVNNLKASLINNNYQLVYENIIKADNCLRKYATHLRQKGYSTPFKWFFLMRNQFELAGKISGSGYGDFGIIIYHEQDTLINHQVTNKAFNKYGLIPFDFNIVNRTEDH